MTGNSFVASAQSAKSHGLHTNHSTNKSNGQSATAAAVVVSTQNASFFIFVRESIYRGFSFIERKRTSHSIDQKGFFFLFFYKDVYIFKLNMGGLSV